MGTGKLLADDTSSSGIRARSTNDATFCKRRVQTRSRRFPKRPKTIAALICTALVCSAGLWITYRASEIQHHLTSAASLIPELKLEITGQNDEESRRVLDQMQSHTQAARNAANDPLWKFFGRLPLVGGNFDAISGIADSAELVATGAGEPLLNIARLASSGTLTPTDGGVNIGAITDVAPQIAAASQVVETANVQLAAVDSKELLPQVSASLNLIAQNLEDFKGPLKLGAEVAEILPSMLGSTEPRHYLLLVQNSAEVRATGGLPGALAVVRVANGKIDLTAQVGGVDIRKFTPPIEVDLEQERIYSSKLGTYIADVNLTPDFPTAARTAKIMWETEYGTNIDGVIAIDPIVLSHVLAVSGPLPFATDAVRAGPDELPSTLTAENVVSTLLSDVYAVLDTQEQDKLFASAAKQVFEALTTGRVPAIGIALALSQSLDENRIRLWSQYEAEQRLLLKTKLAGSISSGPEAGPGSFGVFFNDGTGAKMDYYVHRTVQLIQQCPHEGVALIAVRVSLTNNAPADAAAILPAAVTGGGHYGIPPGSIQTNIVAYGPAQADVETAMLDGVKVSFAPYRHSNRPVGVVTTRLAPGESKTFEFAFTKVAADSKPEVIVTPTVENLRDVALPTVFADCR